jgi:hypothetical protein
MTAKEYKITIEFMLFCLLLMAVPIALNAIWRLL